MEQLHIARFVFLQLLGFSKRKGDPRIFLSPVPGLACVAGGMICNRKNSWDLFRLPIYWVSTQVSSTTLHINQKRDGGDDADDNHILLSAEDCLID